MQAPLTFTLKQWTHQLACYGLDPQSCLSFCPSSHNGRILISCSSTQLTVMLTPINGRVFLLNYKHIRVFSVATEQQCWTELLTSYIFIWEGYNKNTFNYHQYFFLVFFKQRLYKWDFPFHYCNIAFIS